MPQPDGFSGTSALRSVAFDIPISPVNGLSSSKTRKIAGAGLLGYRYYTRPRTLSVERFVQRGVTPASNNYTRKDRASPEAYVHQGKRPTDQRDKKFH
jgi:hypothetical protein